MFPSIKVRISLRIESNRFSLLYVLAKYSTEITTFWRNSAKKEQGLLPSKNYAGWLFHIFEQEHGKNLG